MKGLMKFRFLKNIVLFEHRGKSSPFVNGCLFFENMDEKEELDNFQILEKNAERIKKSAVK